MRLLLLTFITLSSAFSVFAQWKTYSSAHYPLKNGDHIPLLSSDVEQATIYLFKRDTSYHFMTINATGNLSYYPATDVWLDTVATIMDCKNRNDKLWCVTSEGLYQYASGVWSHYAYPPQFEPGSNGLQVLADNSIWLTGGPGQRGISRFKEGEGWTHINQNTHANFAQDMWLSDLKVDETDNIVWIGTNCFSPSAGVYAYKIATNTLIYYPNGEPKYGCVHAVAPAKGKVFVGTSNFSSVRILEQGNYTQNLNAPIVKWVHEMRVDPLNNEAVWVQTDIGLMYFKDTLTYQLFDTVNSPLRGYGNEISVRKKGADSAEVLVATTKGLFGYSYKTGSISTGLATATQLDFRIWPNPSTGLVYVDWEQITQLNERPELCFYSVDGQLVHPELTTTESGLTCNFTGLAAGIYYVHAKTANRVVVKKLVLSGR